MENRIRRTDACLSIIGTFHVGKNDLITLSMDIKISDDLAMKILEDYIKKIGKIHSLLMQYK